MERNCVQVKSLKKKTFKNIKVKLDKLGTCAFVILDKILNINKRMMRKSEIFASES